MLERVKKNRITIAFAILGLIGGYMYWYFVGCADGTCAIQSNPWRMTPYGGVLGGLIGNIVQDVVQKRSVKKQS